MFKLMKYDFRRCYLPFVLIMIFDLGLLLLNLLGGYSTASYDYKTQFNLLEDIIIIIYGSRELYRDFCSERNILGLTMPVGMVKRFLSKFLILNLCYIILETFRLFDMINSGSVYNELKGIIINYNEYAFYDFSGRIIFYASTMAVIAFALILSNSLTKKKAIVPVLNVVMIVLLMYSSISVFPKQYEKLFGTREVLEFEFRQAGAKKYFYRSGYAPFNYGVSYDSVYTAEPGSLQSYSWFGVVYGTVMMFLSLAGVVILVKRKGINY